MLVQEFIDSELYHNRGFVVAVGNEAQCTEIKGQQNKQMSSDVSYTRAHRPIVHFDWKHGQWDQTKIGRAYR